jgi:hypothetical protein
MKYRVEFWSKKYNNWVILSRHTNKEYAEINAEITSKSRKCDARVILDGEIVAFYKGVK